MTSIVLTSVGLAVALGSVIVDLAVHPSPGRPQADGSPAAGGPSVGDAGTGAASTSPEQSPTPTVPIVANPLPYVMPGIGGDAKKVLAHYFPPYPVSLDNVDPSRDYYARHYLNPAGENGKFADVGGLLRDRPLPNAPLPGDWEAANLLREVQQAASEGIDGFAVDILTVDPQDQLWAVTVGLERAAEASGTGFVIVPNLDATSSAIDDPSLVAGLAQLLSSPAAYRLADGRPVLSSFDAEVRDPAWWSDLLDALRTGYGIDAAFIAVFVNVTSHTMQAFAPISYGLGNWGGRSTRAVDQIPDLAAEAHALGMVWMQAVAVQDARPTQTVYAEAGNTETLRASWERVISDGADLVQLATWNDYSESTSFAPSVAHGWAFLDIAGYYVSWFKNGSPPAITGDDVFITHRIQPYAAQPRLPHDLMEDTLESDTTPPRDTVEALVMVQAPATVTVSVGGRTHTVDAPAGLSAYTFPLALGTVTATVARAGVVVASVQSPFTVVAAPYVQDLQYYAASSVRH